MIWVPGTPASYSKGRSTVKVSPAQLKEWKRTVGLTWRKRHGPGPPLPGPVALELRFKVARAHKDLDNMTKAVLDSLRHVAFLDDDRVYALGAKCPACGTFVAGCIKEPVATKLEEGVAIEVGAFAGPAFKQHLGGR